MQKQHHTTQKLCQNRKRITAYIIGFIGSSSHLLKGFVYGLTVWFGTFAITLLFSEPEFKQICLGSFVANFIQAVTWGLILTVVIHKLPFQEVK